MLLLYVIVLPFAVDQFDSVAEPSAKAVGAVRVYSQC